MEKVLLINNANIQPILTKIQNILMQKAMYEKKPQNNLNKTYFGGIGFWFQRDINNTTDYYLIYDTHPKEWDVELIFEDIRNFEHSMFEQTIF